MSWEQLAFVTGGALIVLMYLFVKIPELREKVRPTEGKLGVVKNVYHTSRGLFGSAKTFFVIENQSGSMQKGVVDGLRGDIVEGVEIQYWLANMWYPVTTKPERKDDGTVSGGSGPTQVYRELLKYKIIDVEEEG